MSIDWSPLRGIMRRAAGEDALPQVWWRDDDATGPTPALHRLLDLADALAVPVHLAIIPSLAVPELANAISGRPVVPVVHGWAHRNHAPAGEKKSEFGHPRPGAVNEAGAGLIRLRELIPQAAPMFVPPWNRIAPEIVAELAGQGFRALSTFTARGAPRVAGLDVINAHLDPVAWKSDRGCLPAEDLIARATSMIEARLKGDADADEPFGLLTHHLVQDDTTWDFSRAFLSEMKDAGCAVWTCEDPE